PSGADPRARRRARRERTARPARPLPARSRRRAVGAAVDAERGARDRRCDARSRLLAGGRQGGSDPRAGRAPARPSRRGAGIAARPPLGRERRGGRDVRAGALRMTPDAGFESLPWEEQAAADDDAYRSQLAYLLERSAFYRRKLGIGSAEEARGLDDIAGLPLTDKQELKAGATPDNPFGPPPCARPSEPGRLPPP